MAVACAIRRHVLIHLAGSEPLLERLHLLELGPEPRPLPYATQNLSDRVNS